MKHNPKRDGASKGAQGVSSSLSERMQPNASRIDGGEKYHSGARAASDRGLPPVHRFRAFTAELYRLYGELWMTLEGTFWDKYFGIATLGYQLNDPSGEHKPYATIPYMCTFRILNALDLTAEDVFIDIGCGKGQVTCLAARYNVRRVIGVDYMAGLCEKAKANARRMRGRQAPISIWHGEAREFDYPCGTVFYLANPFGPRIMSEFLDRLQQGVRSNPPPIRRRIHQPAAGTTFL